MPSRISSISHSAGGGNPKESKYSGGVNPTPPGSNSVADPQQQTQWVPGPPRSSMLIIQGECFFVWISSLANMPLMGIFKYWHHRCKSKSVRGTSTKVGFFLVPPRTYKWRRALKIWWRVDAHTLSSCGWTFYLHACPSVGYVLAHMSDLCLAQVNVHARFVLYSALYFFDLPGGQVQSVAAAGNGLVFKSERNGFSWPKGAREANLLPVRK